MADICLLGTGGMLPLKDRFLTSLYVEQNGKALLIDCGEGTQVAMGVHGLKMSRIEALLITHDHADHVTGLPGLLLSIGNCSRTEPLDIYLPESCVEAVKSLMSVCGYLPYEVRLNTLSSKKSESFRIERIDPMLTVNTLPLQHSTECIGYSLEFSRKPVFDPQKAKSLGVPVQQWKLLHAGETVVLEDGREITQAQVTGEQRGPLKITYTTDTRPLDSIVEFAANADLFICEGMYGDKEKKQSMKEKGHMLMQDACELAKKANAKRLWLTHYSPAEKEPEKFTDELKTIFEGVAVSSDGMKLTL
ncbi:MAG: ribonuclease Z [Ruminococcus sp.]|nr:ribonuclease Z [Ruminococcus sp.]